MADDPLVIRNPWQALRRYTSARIALGRVGGSLPTSEMLAFQLDHARARDAVHLPFDAATLEAQLVDRGHEVLRLHSAAPTRTSYLQRPDLGRLLDRQSRLALTERAAQQSGYDAVFVIADGLSALAVHQHAIALLDLVYGTLSAAGWRIAPVVLAEQARVALGDEIGALLQAQQTALLIGERPGLSAADSLGVYLTYGPRPGRSDAERNCISNIRPEGLSYAVAAHKLVYLMREASRLQLSGVELKDASEETPLLGD